jgi:hypothetical protein
VSLPEEDCLLFAESLLRYVGNKMATFVMQSQGCDVSAINTVHYSNHLAYKQVKGTKSTAEEIEQLYEGLRQSNLTNFDVLLTGYVPSAAAVRAVGKIGRDIKFNAGTKPGSFFWGAYQVVDSDVCQADKRQCLIRSWETTASYISPRMRSQSTKPCCVRPI